MARPPPTLRSISLCEAPHLSDVHELSNLQEVQLVECDQVLNLKGLNKVRCVEIISCRGLHDISDLGSNQIVKLHDVRKVVDFSSLRTVPKVVLTYCNITNGYEVEGVQHLVLSNDGKIVDISMLGNVSQLELLHCPRINSLVGLKSIDTIEISDCPSISSYSELGNNRKCVFHLEFSPVVPEFQNIFPHNSYFHYEDKSNNALVFVRRF